MHRSYALSPLYSLFRQLQSDIRKWCIINHPVAKTGVPRNEQLHSGGESQTTSHRWQVSNFTGFFLVLGCFKERQNAGIHELFPGTLTSLLTVRLQSAVRKWCIINLPVAKTDVLRDEQLHSGGESQTSLVGDEDEIYCVWWYNRDERKHCDLVSAQ